MINPLAEWVVMVNNALEEEGHQITEILLVEDMTKTLEIETRMIQEEEELCLLIATVKDAIWIAEDATVPIFRIENEMITFLLVQTEVETEKEAVIEAAVEAGMEETKIVEERVIQTTSEMRVQLHQLPKLPPQKSTKHQDQKAIQSLFLVSAAISLKRRSRNISAKSELSRKINVPEKPKFTCIWIKKPAKLRESARLLMMTPPPLEQP